MTKNQIEYGKLLEAQRSNRAAEELTRVRDERNYAISSATLAETQRSNLANEAIRKGSLDESIRSNLASEAETHRANVARESETYRSNVARETETKRSNLQSERYRAQQLALDTEIRRGELAEAIRSHKANESLGWSKLDLGYANLDELERSNRARESLSETDLERKEEELAVRQQVADTQDYDAESRRMTAQVVVDNANAQKFQMYQSGFSSAVRGFVSAAGALSLLG